MDSLDLGDILDGEDVAQTEEQKRAEEKQARVREALLGFEIWVKWPGHRWGVESLNKRQKNQPA